MINNFAVNHLLPESSSLSENTVKLLPNLWETLIKPNKITESLKSILDAIDDAIIFTDKDRNMFFLNSAAEIIFGDRSIPAFFQEKLKLLKMNSANSDTSSSIEELSLSDSMVEREIEETKIFLRHAQAPDGIWIKVTEKTVKDVDGYLKGSIIVCRDIGKYRHIKQQLLEDAYCDNLTELPNRNLLLENIQSAINLFKQRKDYSFALLFLDVDRFKVINDSLGYKMGDRLLIAISQRLKNCLRFEDTIARLSGDEFAILLENPKDISGATQVAERIYNALIQPFLLDENEIFVDVSIGITMSEMHYQQPEEVLRDADTAMHHAKGLGKACYQVFNTSMHTRTVTLLQLENNLRRAIKRQEFQLHYQPIVSLTTNRITGFEALVRWKHPERGMIPPGEFIPLAEETGLIIPLDLWVLEEACTQMQQWRQQFMDTSKWTISVNISGRHLSKPNFIEQVKRIIHETNFNPYQLKLEITETVLVKNTEFVTNILRQLQEIGVQLSLDDFGTGYSSLSYLHQFSFNTLKVDRTFIQSMNNSNEKLGIVRTILTLAKNLGMDVVAEGIETENQLDRLKNLKCQYGQGYFFSKPLDTKAVEALIEQESSEFLSTSISHKLI